MKKSAVLIPVALALLGSTSWAQARCVPFTGTINAGVVVNSDGISFFAGIASFSFENGEAMTITINNGLKKGGPFTTDNVWIGTELTTVTFESGDAFVLPTQFTAVQSEGRVNETGTIAPVPGATGKFANVSGHFTSHGSFGFGVPLPDMDPPLGFAWVGVGWNGEYHGNICGMK